MIPPFKVKAVEPIRLISKDERKRKLEDAGWNLFNLSSEDVYIDLLTDSGTGAMSQEQWAALMRGDEAYAGSKSFYRMQAAVKEIMGFPYLIPTHQGRGAEKVLDAAMVKPGMLVPGNTHFDTTKAHIEFQKGKTIDCTVDAERADKAFLGNIDPAKLTRAIEEYGKDKIAYVLCTITCNSGGGQPVSLQNIKAVSEIASRHGIPFFFDAARYAENAYFIKQREPKYKNQPIPKIVHEVMSYADGCLMSSKKDAIVPIGGFIALNSKTLYEELAPYSILFEGFLSYGGMAGHDMEALATGLQEGIDEDYLAYRIAQVAGFGAKLSAIGLPVMQPIGGHAVYLDAGAFLSHIPWDQFPGHALACAIYLESGTRTVEIGSLLEGRDPETKENRMAKKELTRLALPRRVYTDEHLDYVAETMKRIYSNRSYIPGFAFKNEFPILRHFQSTFQPLGKFPY